MKLVLSLILSAVVVLAAETPKSVELTEADKLTIRTLQLKQARIELAKQQIIAEEKSTNDALQALVQSYNSKGCILQDDLTCQKPELPKPEPKKKSVKAEPESK